MKKRLRKTLLRLFLTAMLCVQSDPIARAEGNTTPPKKVLIVYSKPSSAYDIALSTIKNVFQEKNVPVAFTLFYEQNDPKLEKQAFELGQSHQFDLIFTMGSDATDFFYKNFIHQATPIVSVSSKDPVLLGQMADYEHGSGINMAFTSLNMPIDVQISYLKQVKPHLKNMAVLYSLDNKSAVVTQVDPLKKIAEQQGIHILDVAVQDSRHAKSELALKMPQAVAAMKQTDPTFQESIFWITGTTSVFKEISTINQYATYQEKNSDSGSKSNSLADCMQANTNGLYKIPVLSAVPDVVQGGEDSAVLSIGISFDSNAEIAALYGIDILDHKSKASELKVGLVDEPDIAINFQKAKEEGVLIPFSFFEAATILYDYTGRKVRDTGQMPLGK